MSLHQGLPDDMRRKRPLPGIQPVQGDWFRVDEAYAGQMALRREMLATRRADVLACPEAAEAPAQELFDLMLELLPAHGFTVESGAVLCPDGVRVRLDRGDPLGTLGQIVQCDLCLLDKPAGAEEHLLGGAVLCFPAGWTLAEKVGRPMMRIHKPVAVYEPDVGRRVQRLLDGVQVGRPLWRSNQLYYEHASLFAPRKEADPSASRSVPADRPYFRAERQTLLRLPQTRWVLFAIHTYVMRRADADPA